MKGPSSTGSRRLETFTLALLIDLVLGDPPNRVHPVAWFGRAAAAVEKRAPRDRMGRLIYGSVGALLLAVAYARVMTLAVRRRRFRPSLLLSALALKSTFAVHGLISAADDVYLALAVGDVERARGALKALVSREASGLDSEQIISAAVESLAENTVDSFLSPWLYYWLFGLEGALAFRAVNTLDSMWGYRTEAFEALGKAAARLDDALNYLPATLAGRLIPCVGAFAGFPKDRAFEVLRRDGAKTASPNAGRPMSAMAGVLGVRLSKEGGYVLGDETRRLEPRVIREAERVVGLTAALAAGLTALLCLFERSK